MRPTALNNGTSMAIPLPQDSQAQKTGVLIGPPVFRLYAQTGGLLGRDFQVFQEGAVGIQYPDGLACEAAAVGRQTPVEVEEIRVLTRRLGVEARRLLFPGGTDTRG